MKKVKNGIFVSFIFALPLSKGLHECTTYQFPKIIGGQSNWTYVIQLDVFNDDMAFTGGSYDQPLTTNPIPTSPIIGVIIVS